ncbi:MAG: hypothetical protein K6G24_07105 [Lachnospiraceae bacterium]|nr:hypothetical protein [Lachnospiraceae bacterium]
MSEENEKVCCNCQHCIREQHPIYHIICVCEITSLEVDILAEAVRNGIVLPKGHGRLFDERDIVNGNYEVIGNRIYELEPIIEADKEANNG